MISYSTIEKIKSQVNIVDVISHYIDVEKKGSNYVALCPFHNDSNPSMQISTSKQIFKCFVCGTSGDAFGFVKQYEKISFTAAVKKVCEICHIDVPELANYIEVKKERKNESELIALEKLSKYYEYMLITQSGKNALDYLKNRDLTEDIIKKFHIGYAPSENQKSIEYLRNKEKISIETLESAGIISPNSTNFSDKYRDRIMFPLSDISGELVGFSGRKYLDDDPSAKYMNSSESVVFKKSELLYNFNNAKDAIRKANYVYVVEGFMDAIAIYRAGIPAVVGLMGTAFTSKHVELFAKMKVEVRLCLDSDEPGQHATEKCLSALSGHNVSVKVVRPLDEGKDPDEYLKEKGPEALREVLNKLDSPLIHSANYLNSHSGLLTYEDKETFLRQNRFYYYQLGKLGQDDIISKLATLLNLSTESIKNLFASYSTKKYIQTISNEHAVHFTPSDLSKVEINNELQRYINDYLDADYLKQKFQNLIRNEGQILSRIILSRDTVKLMETLEDRIVVDSYGQMIDLLGEFYSDLHSSVDFIREEDFSALKNLAEIFYSEQFDMIRDYNSSDTEALKSIENNKIISDGLILRLENCKYPGRVFRNGDFNLLLKAHKKYLREYDLRNPTNNDTFEKSTRVLAKVAKKDLK